MAGMRPVGAINAYHVMHINPADFIYEAPHLETFSVEELEDCTFTIELDMDSYGCDGPDIHEVKLSVHKTDEEEITADITIRMYSPGLRVKRSKRMNTWTDKCKLENFFMFAPLHELNQKLTITCEILWYGPSKMSKTLTSFSVHDDFQHFLLQPSLSDVKIITGEEELPAHKLILGSHSPVFLSMFETDMIEARENRIFIKDFTPEVIKNVLSILYTGSSECLNNYVMALKILIFAEKYDMKKLKDLCEYKLFKQLTVSNALEILSSAEDHNAEKLRETCLDFISENKTDIVNDPDFQILCMKKPQLILFFMKKVLSK